MTSLLHQRIAALTAAIRDEGTFEAAARRNDVAAVAEAVRELWHRNHAWEVVLDEGRPGVTQHGGQLGWMRRWLASKGSVFNGSGRQRGKSLWCFAVLDTYCRRWPGARTRWCGLTIDTARAIVGQAMADYLLTCPEALHPKPDGDDWVYPNGSRIIVMGTDAVTFRRGRGFGRIGVDVRDEYGFFQRPSEVDRALNPGLQVPGPSGEPGRVIYSTTPSESPAHESNAVAEAHIARGAFELETYLDNPRVEASDVERAEMERSGLTREELLDSTAFRREYRGERIIEEARAAVPRWGRLASPDGRTHPHVVELPRPEYFDGYEALDPGRKVDPHAALLAWFDFSRQLLYFEHELELPSVRHTVADIAAALKQLEGEAWGLRSWDGTLFGSEYWHEKYGELPVYLQSSVSEHAPRQPFLRVGDNDDLVLHTLHAEHGIAIFPTEKSDKHLQVDSFNELVTQGRIKVHPRCVRLRAQLAGTLWNEKRTAWVRTAIDHGDLLDCAIYIARNVAWHRDCRPRPKLPWEETRPPSSYEAATGLRRRLG